MRAPLRLDLTALVTAVTLGSGPAQDFLDAAGRPQLHKPFELALLPQTPEKVLSSR